MSSTTRTDSTDPAKASRGRRLPNGLSRIDQPATGVDVGAHATTGRIVDHGAQVLSWTPPGGSEVLWLSPTARFGPGEAIRGGIPVCFPWFGPGVSGDRLPAHGVARTSDWRLVESGTPDGVAHLLYSLDAGDIATSPAPDSLPAGASAHLSVAMDAQLRLDLTVQAGSEPFTFEAALHTYFRVGDVRRVRITGLDDVGYHDKVSGAEAVQQGDVTFDGEVDRVYDTTRSASIVDPALGRTIVVTKHDSASTIVWNPGAELAHSMGDVPDDAWPDFVCVEVGNVGRYQITLQPGQGHTMTLICSVQHD